MQESLQLFIEQKGLNLGPMTGLSTMTMLQLTRCCQAVSSWKIDYWNRTPTLFPWCGSKWLLAVSKNKVCLRGTNISGYWRHPKHVTMPLEAISQQEFQKCFQQWQHH